MDQMNTKQSNDSRGMTIHSIKSKMAGLVVGQLMIMAVLLLVLVIPKARTLMGGITQNYLRDITIAHGMMLDEKIHSDGTEKALTAENLTRMMQNVGIEGVSSSYVYVISADGRILYHPQTELIGTATEKLNNTVVNDIVAQVRDGQRPETDVVSYDHGGVAKYAAFYVNEAGEFILGFSADESEIMKDISMITKVCVVAALLTLIVCSILGYFTAHKMVRPIVKITEVVNKLSELDFTDDEAQEKMNKRKDETVSMSRAISVLRGKLTQVLANLQEQSEMLFDASDSLNTNAAETANTVEQVEKAVNEISQGATSQAEETQKATENVILMGNMVEETSGKVQGLIVNATEMKNSGDEAMAILSQLGHINQRASQAIDVIYEQTNTTNESALKIREATSLITSIAEETNLLSLNASIEAARAGEQGRGFAVVASQIQKLAEQSNESARQIETIIDSLISDSEKAVSTMDEVKEIMNQQSDNVEKTEEIFTRVKNGIDSSIQDINAISEDTRQMDSARVNVVDVVQNLTAIAEENAASTEQTSASVTEVSSIVYDISENAEKLKSIADELEKDMKIFKV